MLNRLDVRQKLSLLLMLPLIAVVCTIVPFTVERVDNARAAATTLRIASTARQVGALIQNLQQERVLSLGYLLLPSVDRGALLAQQRTVDDGVTRLRGSGPAAPLSQALDRISTLDGSRQQVLGRAASPASIYQGYHDAIQALLDALGLTKDPSVDAVGLHQLDILDVLLPANEQASQVAAALVIAAADPAVGAPLLTAAMAGEQEQRARFDRLATDHQVALLDQVETGAAGGRINQLATTVGGTGRATTGTDLATVLAVASSYGQLRQIVEDYIAVGIANAAEQRARNSATAAGGVAGAAVLAFIVVIALSVRVSRSIAAPLRRLSRAAGAVADIAGAELARVDDSDEVTPSHPRLAAVNVRSEDEIGELAAAINRVQAIAALMLERQVTTRRNVSVMFANIARRTQSLVARQLTLIDDMERNEQDPQALERLYRLDHLTTRLRRSADSLLVVSGNQDDALDVPTPLLEVIRAATGEIEGFQTVRLGDVPELLIAIELASDLRLLLAELLENATAFSPPGVPVEVSAELVDGCRIAIVDYGIGMSPVRLAQENQRLLERPRLDVAPTDVLGLFVVGRLARRHGLTVRLAATDGRGVTATVTVPPALFSMPQRAVGSPARPAAIAPVPFVELSDSPFTWFAPGLDRYENTGAEWQENAGTAQAPGAAGRAASVPGTLAAPATPATPVAARNGLNRRIPNQFLAAFQDGLPPASAPRVAEPRDAAAEAAQLDAFTEGTVRALSQARQEQPVRPAPRAESRVPAEPRVPPAAPWPAVTPPATMPATMPPTAVPATAMSPAAMSPATMPPVEAPPSVRHGLTRRTPGAHLAPSARPPAAQPLATPSVAPRRDPEFERDSIEQFVEGLTRAAYGRSEDDPR